MKINPGTTWSQPPALYLFHRYNFFSVLAISTALSIAGTGDALAQTKHTSEIEKVSSQTPPPINDSNPLLHQITSKAKNGDPHAQFELGMIYRTGKITDQNFSLSVHWIRQAAAQNLAKAQNALGKAYADGLGVEVNLESAHQWLENAARQGSASHQHDFGMLLDNERSPLYNPEESARWYQLAAQQGFHDSIANLGLMHYQGRGVSRDIEKAKSLLMIAATNGHAAAQNNLGLMYTRDDGLQQDYEKAVHWFRQAADQGQKQAIRNLGVMFENGFGVEFDEAEAHRLYRLANAQVGISLIPTLQTIGMPFDKRMQKPGTTLTHLNILRQQAISDDPIAHYLLAYQLSTDPDNSNFLEAAKLYQSAASKGLKAAQLNLGLLYMRGVGVPQNFVNGYRLITRAAANGSDEAIDIRNNLARFLTADQISAAQNP